MSPEAVASTVNALANASAYSIDTMQVLRSSWVILLMIALSVLVVGITFERFFYFMGSKLDSDAFMEKISKLLDADNFDGAIELCKKSKGSIPKVVKIGIESRKFEAGEIDKIMEAERMEQRVNLERYLNIVGTLGNTAPFIGLLGTVLGIIKAFKDLASSAGGGPEVVMVGIAEALIATAAGLAVAIPAVIIFNVFMKTVKDISVEMDTVSKKLLVMLTAEGKNVRKRG